jgi:predicted GIY-YIG superfamily endonuclease
MYKYLRKYFTYIARCADGSYYTGQTDNLILREKEHNGTGRYPGARYTETRRPVQIVFSEPWETRAFAMHREKQLKDLSHKQKEDLVNGVMNY